MSSPTDRFPIANYIKVTCMTSTLTHYLMFKSGDSNIYMATYITAEPTVGELRFIARLLSNVLPSEYPFGSVSTTAGSSSAVEGSDVYLVNGQTRSKFYSSQRFIDDPLHCVYSDSFHACMAIYNYESSSGGPFFRDIDSNNAGPSTNLYFYMNSGHVQTEAWRTGLHGPYALMFTRSGIPTNDGEPDWIASMGLQGYVQKSGRYLSLLCDEFDVDTRTLHAQDYWLTQVSHSPGICNWYCIWHKRFL
jgi:rhamnogalacturonan endolyase